METYLFPTYCVIGIITGTIFLMLYCRTNNPPKLYQVTLIDVFWPLFWFFIIINLIIPVFICIYDAAEQITRKRRDKHE